ncbi:MAG: enoyl-CoA hydratase [Burkholderiales bacterium]|nr:enoyl-CoA hydratase [Burkholderiales bacterium]
MHDMTTPTLNLAQGQPSGEPAIKIEVVDRIAFVTLNRPVRFNALSADVLAALHESVDSLSADANIRVVILAAQGKAFCAGHDLKELNAASPEQVETLFRLCSDLMLKLTRMPQPVIAEVSGMATAAGCQLVAQCDLAVAADHAKFAVSGINLGLFCSTPAVPLSRAIARKRAAEMLFTGDFIDAATALDWGLVNRVVPADQLRATTLALAEKLMAKPRESLATGKALFYRQLEAGLEAAYADASNTIACNFMAPDAQEGVAAFIEKRPPNWR